MFSGLVVLPGSEGGTADQTVLFAPLEVALSAPLDGPGLFAIEYLKRMRK
jgi:hypothetical protein